MNAPTPTHHTDDTAGEPDAMRVGLLAVGLALIVVVAGKLLVAHFGLAYSEVDTIVEDPEMMANVVVYEMAESGIIERDVADYYEMPADQRQPSAEMTRKLMKVEADVASRMANMSQAEKEAAAKTYADAAIGEVPITARMGFSGWDLLWFGLAFLAAYRICATGRSEAIA